MHIELRYRPRAPPPPPPARCTHPSCQLDRIRDRISTVRALGKAYGLQKHIKPARRTPPMKGRSRRTPNRSVSRSGRKKISRTHSSSAQKRRQFVFCTMARRCREWRRSHRHGAEQFLNLVVKYKTLRGNSTRLHSRCDCPGLPIAAKCRRASKAGNTAPMPRPFASLLIRMRANHRPPADAIKRPACGSIGKSYLTLNKEYEAYATALFRRTIVEKGFGYRARSPCLGIPHARACEA